MGNFEVLSVCIISFLIGIIIGILKDFEWGIITFFISLISISIIWYGISKSKEKKKNSLGGDDE